MTRAFAMIPLMGLLFALGCVSGDDRSAEVRRYWRAELKRAKKNDVEEARRQHPEIGWMAGLWRREDQGEATLHMEIEGPLQVRVVTKGFTAVANKVVFKPETFASAPGAEFLDAPIVITNESFYDLWYYPVGTGATSTRWFYVERIRKVSDDRYEVVYRTSYTIRDPAVDFEEFYRAESPRIAWTVHDETPMAYVRADS